MIRSMTVALIAALAACAPKGEPADTLPPNGGAQAPGTIEGRVRIVGSAPVNTMVIVETDDQGSLRIGGPRADEVARLSGARVRLSGRVGPGSDPMVPRQIEVTSYEIVSIDGQPVVMGEIIEIRDRQARLRTDDGVEILLTGVPQQFRVGQRVWVQGPRSLTVQTYGTLSP